MVARAASQVDKKLVFVRGPWRESGSRDEPVREPADICKTTGIDLYLGVIAKAMALG